MRRTGIACVTVLAASMAATTVRAEVWVVDGSVRLDPIDGTLHEERHPAGDAIDASYREDNPVWSSSDRVIRLFAARNEVVAFQVVLDGGPHRGVSLEVSDLVGEARTLPAATHVRRYRQWFFEVSEESSFCEGVHLVTSLGTGWYPDPLVPLDSSVGPDFGQPFDVPDERGNPVDGQTATALWVDVLVPEGAREGTYRGTVTLSFDGGSEELPLEIEVRRITLPRHNHAGLGAVNYGGLGFDVWDVVGPEGLVPWFQEAHAHRLELDAMWVWPNSTPGVSVDWHQWREGFRPFMSGSAFVPEAGYFGPSAGEPIRRFVLPLESNWPGPHHSWEDPRPTDEAFWQQALRDVEAILIEEGWTNIEAHLFINGVDEPGDLETYERIQYYGDLVDGAGLVDRRHILFRLDSGFFKNVGDHIPGWDVERIFAEIGDDIDVWNHNGAPAYIDADATLARIRDNPEEMWWFYTTCSAGEPSVGSPMIEGEALGMRTWGWIVFRYDMDGAVTWEMDGMRNDIDARRCWTDPMCSGWGMNGDAVLFYLGEHVGLEGRPVAGIRVKNMRRGAQDHAYLWLLAQADGSMDRAAGIAAELVPRALDDDLPHDGSTGRWAHDPRAYEAARRRIADLLPLDPEEPTGGPDGGVDGGDAGGPDAGNDGGPSGGSDGSDGCGCQLCDSSSAGTIAMVGLVALVLLWRRRR